MLRDVTTAYGDEVTKKIQEPEQKKRKTEIKLGKIEKLPNELVSSIFEYYREGRPFGEALFPFSLVCKNWAQVAENHMRTFALEYFNSSHQPELEGTLFFKKNHLAFEALFKSKHLEALFLEKEGKQLRSLHVSNLCKHECSKMIKEMPPIDQEEYEKKYKDEPCKKMPFIQMIENCKNLVFLDLSADHSCSPSKELCPRVKFKIIAKGLKNLKSSIFQIMFVSALT